MDYDKTKYKVWELPHPLLLHWILNPGLAFNELVLGQRIPKITLIDQTSDAPLMERQYVPCPHCGTIHNGSRWAKQGAFKNWFGLLCPQCEKIIPCLWNLTSLLLLAATFPIWGWFRRPMEAKWLRFKKTQYANYKDEEPLMAKNTSWLKMALVYGAFMFCFMALPRIVGGDVTSKYIVTQVLIWLFAGLVFGGIMKLFFGRRRNVSKPAAPEE